MPREIRDEIYKLALVAEHPLLPEGVIRVEKDDPANKWTLLRSPRGQDSINLLLTCKQVYYEACPIIYGKNCFTFTNTSAAVKFLTIIRDNIAYIRRIHIKRAWESEHSPRMMEMLVQAPNLQYLAFPWPCIPANGDFSLQKFVRTLMPWVNAQGPPGRWDKRATARLVVRLYLILVPAPEGCHCVRGPTGVWEHGPACKPEFVPAACRRMCRPFADELDGRF
ncbi:hypothetical protein ANO11243_046760 [Dothideomycetidae sp. 11243]|nr:hypothetical protein ANO11243_046760 [fungal sp. No.11243]